MRIFGSGVFHQTAPPIIHFLKPFGILKKFRGVFKVLKRLPGVLDTRSLKRNNEVRNFLKHESSVFVQ